MSKGKKGFDFTLEFEGVYEDEKWKDGEYTQPIQDVINETPFPITNIGFYEDSKNFVIQGQIVRETKQEAEAEYTIFKKKMERTLKKYGHKKSIDRMKLYFTTIR